MSLSKILREEITQYGYRAGSIKPEDKPEKLFNFRGHRGTGHFGTGYYFFGDKKQADDYAKGSGNREVNSIDFSKYNLLRINTFSLGSTLHQELKNINESNIFTINAQKKNYIKKLFHLK